MVKKSELTKSRYKTGEVAGFLGLSPKTVQKYSNEGRLICDITDTGRRMFPREEVIRFLELEGILYDDTGDIKRDAIYARVDLESDSADLERQVDSILESEYSLQDPIVIKEVGSSLDEEREKLTELIHLVENDQVRNVYITQKDRLTKYGFNYLVQSFKAHGTVITVIAGE